MQRRINAETETLGELTEIVLKNKIFQLKVTLEQLRDTATGTKFACRMQFYLWLTLRKEF